jgi:hypothetical protein
MTHFEAYHWEDHVPRAGSWKFNLAAGLLALGAIYAAVPHAASEAPAATATHEYRDAGAGTSHGRAARQGDARVKENERRALCPPLA